MSVRAHVVLPEDLLERIDQVAGKRRRSRFVEEAVREKLAREALRSTLEAGAGILGRDEYPEWSSPDDISRWVSEIREADRRLPEDKS